MRQTLTLYLALVRLAFQRQLTYRTAHLAGLATNAFFGLLRVAVLTALFAARPHVAGYSLSAAVTFTGLTQALLSFIHIFTWWEVMRAIRAGDIAADLARPLDYFGYWAAQDLGRALGNGLFRGLPILALYTLVFPLVWPPTLWHWVALPVSILLALGLSFCWRFGVNLAAFWMQDMQGLGRAAWTLSLFCSGFLMPLAFFPDWAITVMNWTPFPSMITTPVNIFLGLVAPSDLPAALLVQLLWCGVAYALVRLTLAAGVKKLVIQGG